MESKRLEAYADLIVNTGINPDPGQDVVITAGFDQLDFVRLVTEKCYQRGAGKVWFNWVDMPFEKLHAIYQTEERMSNFEAWEIEKLRWQSEKLPARLWLDSDDPDGMDGTDPAKRARAQMAKFPVIKPFRDAMENRHQWCIAGVPGKAWAQKVFPGIPAAEAVEKLWDAILTASRVTEDPEAAWEAHNRSIHARCAHLNSLKLRSLHYTAANGTDFTVGMIPEARFCGGREVTSLGRAYNPNIPSEECFISPKRGEAEGIVCSTKPLIWDSQTIDRFWIRFARGKAVECGAEVGEDLLKKLIAMDEGAAYLGECALVPWESPINQTGILFYNTLFDENACCHLALGKGFSDTIEGCHEKTLDEIHALGVNESIIHEDFMIGTEDLSIDGVTETGETVAIFRNGTWAF